MQWLNMALDNLPNYSINDLWWPSIHTSMYLLDLSRSMVHKPNKFVLILIISRAFNTTRNISLIYSSKMNRCLTKYNRQTCVTKSNIKKKNIILKQTVIIKIRHENITFMLLSEYFFRALVNVLFSIACSFLFNYVQLYK
jgi:hypothetical protein